MPDRLCRLTLTVMRLLRLGLQVQAIESPPFVSLAKRGGQQHQAKNSANPRSSQQTLYKKVGDNLTITEGRIQAGARLREFRMQAGLRQSDVAKLVEVDQAAVSYWESGKTVPAKKHKKKMAKLYNCSEEELLGGGE